jgi:uncharacterized membrane protein
MSDISPIPAPIRSDDRTAPAIAYGLYLLGFVTGITPLVGLIVAYVSRSGAGPIAASHHTFLIYTFWLSIVWFMIGGALVVIGFPLSFVIVGIPAFLLGWAILAMVSVWYAVRCVLGVIYLARGEAYPRPRNWLF